MQIKGTTKYPDRVSPSVWPKFEEDEIQAALTVLQSGKVNYWTGEQGRKFEAEFAAYLGIDFGIALANGTVALELALKSIELRPGDEVIVPARTFIATASAVVACGGIPIVADIDPYSQNISSATIEPLIGKRTRAIIVVHLAGFPAEMTSICDLARQRNLIVIEDCAQAHGALYRNQKVGTLGDIGTFSFCQDKIMTTGGEGGLLVTNSEEIYRKAWSYKDHGKNLSKIEAEPTQEGFRWLHDNFGSNFRMTEMQAAIGRMQLKKISAWLKQRDDHAQRYHEILKDIPGIILPKAPQHMRHAYYKYNFQIVRDKFNQIGILERIKKRGVPVFVGFCPDISCEHAFNQFPQQQHPVAEMTSKRTLMLLLHPTLSPDEITQMGCIVKEELMN